MNKLISNLLVLSIGLSFFSCQQKAEKFNEEEYIKSIQEWKKGRLENLKAENGWLNLVGLMWLNDGENPFGSSEANKIVFPAGAPEFIGSIIVFKDNLSVFINEDIEVFINDSLLKEHDIISDVDKNTTKFSMGSFRWHIIKRGDRYGIRLRDLESPLLEEIKEIPSFPIDTKWRIAAKFEKFDTPKEISVPNVLGETESEKCYGQLKFKIGGEEYSLLPLGDGEDSSFFVIFADGTSAEETYGAGRFLSVDKPDKNGNTIIDFNKATNPPCAFTNYATCPLPPEGNRLTVKILAGEKVNEHIGRH